MNKYELRHQIPLIPDDKKGIYWYCLRFPNAYKLGIYEKNGEIINLHHLIDKIMMFSNVINHIGIDTRVKHKNSVYLTSAFNLSFKSTDLHRVRFNLEKILKNKTIIELRNIIKLLTFSTDKLPPLYIGITENQSFKQRFNQHFNGETSLAPGMDELGLVWDDLSYVIFDDDLYNIPNITDVESLEHYMLKPIFSWR